MSNKTSIVWVPGAWCGPEGFYGVAETLQKEHGYHNVFHRHASVGGEKPPRDPYADAKLIRELVVKELDENSRNVLVVCHSYGGVPSCNALKGLDRAHRQANGKDTGVVGMAFLCSFALPKGVSLLGALGGNPLPWFQMDSPSEGFISVDKEAAASVAFQDVPVEVQQMASAALTHHATNTMTEQVVQYEAYKEIPSSYLVCTEDRAIPPPVQENMIASAGKSAFQYVERIDSSHSPFLSKPDAVVAFIKRAASQAS